LREKKKNKQSKPGQQFYENNRTMVEKLHKDERTQSLEKVQAGFENLIKQLESINDNLTRHTTQQRNLMERVDKLPDILQSFPDSIEHQKELTEQLINQMKSSSHRQEQFAETVGKIPEETARQTDALTNINNQLSAAADSDIQLKDNFGKFNEALNKLDQTTANQTDTIMQMNKTFATSDRYLKYLISRQNRRIIWVFAAAIGISLLVILILAAVVVYIKT